MLLLLLLTLCLLCGAVGASAEEARTGVPVQIGPASFELPADAMVLYRDDTGLVTTSDEYDLWILWYDWAELPAETLESYTKSGVQVDHLYAMCLAQTGDAKKAKQVADLAVETDIGMLNGDDVVYVMQDAMVLCTHYYRHSGFMVKVAPLNAGDPAPWEEMCKAIALSFRLEGVSEEQMIADQVKWVVVTADSARVRNKPDISAAELKLARKGDRFELVRKEGAWYIVLVNGKQGYIHSGVTEVLSGGQ